MTFLYSSYFHHVAVGEQLEESHYRYVDFHFSFIERSHSSTIFDVAAVADIMLLNYLWSNERDPL
jgi:hypothetical protein